MSSPKKRPAKAKEVKSDMQSMIEIVLKSVIAEKGLTTKKQVELAVSKSTAELRQHVSSLETKIQANEAALNSNRINLEEIQRQLIERQQDIVRLNISVEDVQKKCFAMMSKLHKKQKEDLDESKKYKEDTSKLNLSLSEDVRKLNREILSIREAIEEIKHSVGPDLDTRVNALEESVDLGAPGPLGVMHGVDLSASQGGRGRPVTNNYVGGITTAQRSFKQQRQPPISVGAAIQGAYVSLQAHETDIDDLKSKMANLLKESGPDGQDHDLKSLKRKLRSVAEVTSSACRSVSISVSDVQDATLSLYTWADKVHAAFAILSDKVGVRPNVCPRLPTISFHNHDGAVERPHSTMMDYPSSPHGEAYRSRSLPRNPERHSPSKPHRRPSSHHDGRQSHYQEYW